MAVDYKKFMDLLNEPTNAPLGRLVDYSVDGTVVELTYESGKAYADVIRDDIINLFIPFATPDHRSKAIEGDKHVPCEITVSEESEDNDKRVSIATSKLIAVIGNDFMVDIFKSDGEPLCLSSDQKRKPREKVGDNFMRNMAKAYLSASDGVVPGVSGEETQEDGQSTAGDQNSHASADTNAGEKKQDATDLLAAEGHESAFASLQRPAFTVMKQLDGDEKFYGLGDKTGFLNKRGYEYDNWNTDNPNAHQEQFKTLYKTIPFLITLKDAGAYGIFFDNTYKSHFDLGKESSDYFFYQAYGGNRDDYFMAGDTIADVIGAYTYLTGTAPLPQLWTLGYQQSRWGYDSDVRIREIAQHLRKDRIPCDAIHYDIDYMDGYRVFTWDEAHYGAPGSVVKEIAAEGFHSVPIIDPGVKLDPGYFMYDEGEENHYFASNPDGTTYVNAVWPGDAVFPDFGRKEVRKWWASKEKILTDWGFAGTWNDMNEPASFKGELPADVVFHDEERKTTHAEMHNVYGALMSRGTFTGLKEATGRRPYVITRACYSGTQKYSTIWTGDNMSLWMHLQMSIPQLCNLGMSGFALAGTDIGGFGGDSNPELLIRWVEAAVFAPLFRNHSCNGTIYQEPWMWDQKTEDIYRRVVEFRYQILPYLYDLARECESDGLPIMRPLVLHYQDDPMTFNLNDEFLVGESLLAAPVVEQGANQRMVYLPAGTWYDYFTREKYEGGRTYVVDAPLDKLPLFAKAGSIIPHWEVMQYVGEKPYDTLYLRVFPGDGSYTHYRDNGVDFAYRDGEYDTYHFAHENGRVSGELTHQGYGHIYGKIVADDGETTYEITV